MVPQTTAAQTIGTVELNKDNATLKVVEVPDGFSVDPSTGVISKVAGKLLSTGDYVIKAKAIDGHFGDNAPTRNLTIHVVMDVTPIPDQVWTERQVIPAIPITMKSGATITNVEVEKNDQTYAYLKGGVGNQITGIALKATTDKQEATVVVTYTAVDGTSQKVKTTFNYIVKTNPAPIALDVTNAKQSVVEGNRFADMKITATAGATITVDEATLPYGTRYDSKTQTITGVGYYEGKYNVLVTATLGDGKTSRIVELTVTPGNFTVPNTSHEFVAGSEIKPIQVHMEDNWTITDVGGSLPSGLSWSSDRRQITGTPTEVGNWRAEVRIRRVTKGGTQQEAVGYINIRVTSVPVSLAISNSRQTVTVLDPIQEMAVVASRGATVSMLSGSLPAGVSYDPNTGKISGTPTAIGTFTATFSAGYPAIYGSQTATGTVTIVVNPRPLDVTIAGNEQTVTVLSPIQNITLSAPAKAEVTVDESKLPDGVTYNRATKTFSGTPRKVGTYEIPVTATYPTMANSPVGRATVKIKVNPLPATIAISNKDQTINLGERIKNAVVTHNSQANLTAPYLSADLPESDVASYVAALLGIDYNPTTNTFSGTPTRAGIYKIRLRATNPADLGGATAEDTMTVTVRDDAIDISLSQSQQIVIKGNAIRQVTVNHTQGSTLSVNNADLPAGLSFNAQTGILSGTPTTVGSYTIPVTATKAGKTAKANILIDVIELKKSEDGKSPTVTAERGTNEVGGTTITGTWVIITPAGGGTPSRTFVPDGKNGRDGVNGQTISVVTSKDRDTTTIKFYVDSNGNGEQDGDEPIIRTAVIKDGQKGADGQAGAKGADGKSPTVTTERGTNTVGGKEVNGTWVIVTPADGGTPTRTFVADGAKGEKGDKGETGANGAKGEDGKNGVDG